MKRRALHLEPATVAVAIERLAEEPPADAPFRDGEFRTGAREPARVEEEKHLRQELAEKLVGRGSRGIDGDLPGRALPHGGAVEEEVREAGDGVPEQIVRVPALDHESDVGGVVEEAIRDDPDRSAIGIGLSDGTLSSGAGL